MSTDGAALPWSLSDARITFSACAAGVGLLVWGWWGSSGTGDPQSQTNFLMLGVAGLVAMGLGYLFWLTSARRAVRLRRDGLVERLEQVVIVSVATMPDPGGTRRRWVVSSAGARYHRDDCLLVRGKKVRPLTNVGGSGALRPCEMCEP